MTIRNTDDTISVDDAEQVRDDLFDELETAWTDLFEDEQDAYDEWLADKDSDITTMPVKPPELEVWIAQQAEDHNLEHYEIAVEYLAFEKLCDQCEKYGGGTLISESHFEDYIREMLCETYDIATALHNVLVIDWAATAEQCRSDYTEVDFDSAVYYLSA